MERYALRAAAILSKALEGAAPAAPAERRPLTSLDLELPPDPAHGDFGFPCFRLAKELRKAPPVIAKEMADKAAALLKGTPDEQILSVEAAGPYVNFRVKPDVAKRDLLGDILRGPGNGSYGRLEEKTRGRWIMEYSSPNIAKPFMAGHLRSTALGAALSRVARYRGFDVIALNHLGDWGTQYGKLAVAFRLYGGSLPAEPSIRDLVDIYVKFHDAVEKQPELEDEAREAFRKLEEGDPEITALWKKCVDISMKEFNRTYKRLGVEFTHNWGESYYKDMLEPLVERLQKQSLLEESEGALVVRVTDDKGNEIPPTIIKKKDGATIYATRDVAAAIYRWENFHFDRMSYIVGGEQKLHFQQVFGVLRRMGFDWVSRCEHIPYGLYRMKGGKMSTRKGNFITLEDVIETTREKVLEVIRSREVPAGMDVEATAEAVALGAVIFNDLSNDPAKDLDFDVERVVDFQGETGPYLHYAHTRCLSIIRNAGETDVARGFRPEAVSGAELERLIGKLTAQEELLLLKVLGRFPNHLERTISFAKASQLCHYLIDVTKAFNAFYRECHVINQGDADLTKARLLLVEAARRVLAQGLGMVGLPLPERM